MTTPELCDNLGAIEDPLRPGCLKKCPECYNPVSPMLTLTLAGWIFGPEGPDEDDLPPTEKPA